MVIILNYALLFTLLYSNIFVPPKDPPRHIKIAPAARPSVCPSVRQSFLFLGHNFVLHEWISIYLDRSLGISRQCVALRAMPCLKGQCQTGNLNVKLQQFVSGL